MRMIRIRALKNKGQLNNDHHVTRDMDDDILGCANTYRWWLRRNGYPNALLQVM